MKKKSKKTIVKKSARKNDNCCKVESIISVDERGQMVLPKKLRDKAGIKANDKLTVITWCKGKKICCMSLIKSDEFIAMVKGKLGPMMKDIIKSKRLKS